MAVLQDSLFSVQHPLTGSTTYIPALEGRVDWTLNHKDSTYHVDFSDGGLSSYGVSPFDLEIRRIVVEFTVPFGVAIPGIPASPFANSTAVNDYLMKACGHGIPMWLTFAMADGTYRYWYARSISREFTPDTTTPVSAKYRLQFVSEEALLTANAPVGGPVKWDDPAISWDQAGIFWDTAVNQWTMTSGAPTTNSGGLYAQQRVVTAQGTAPTRDMYLVVSNNDSNPLVGPFYLFNSSVFYGNANFLMAMNMISLSVAAGHSITFDIANLAVSVGDGSSFIPAYANFIKPDYQDEWFRLEPGVNNLTLAFPNSNTPNVTWAVVYTPKFY